MNDPKKIPVIKKDAKFLVEIDYKDAGSIVQALFILAANWSQETKDSFKKAIDEKAQLTDPQMITYIILDQLYRKILTKAQKEDQIEYTDLVIPSPLKENLVESEK